ncbi:MAG TPA: hypothetical protein VGK54_13545 [Chloroflexota bacterium]
MWTIQQEIGEFDAQRFTSLGPGYLALNLAGEAGELANFVKKLWRRDSAIGGPEGFGVLGDGDRAQVADELADIAILAMVLANHLDIDVESEARKKLAVIDQRLQAGYYGQEAATAVPPSA